MNEPLEDYLQKLLIEEDCESAMDSIIKRFVEADASNQQTAAPQAQEINAEDLTKTGIYFMFDPFTFLLFNKDGTEISTKVISYCQQALADYNRYKDNYKFLCFMSPYIKNEMYSTIFTGLTRAFVNSQYASKLKGIEIVRGFYDLLNSNKIQTRGDDNYVFTNYKSWNDFSKIARNPSNRVFTYEDFGGSQYRDIKTAVKAQGVAINYENVVIPAMELLTKIAKQFDTAVTKDKKPEKVTPYQEYVSFMIAGCSNDLSATEESYALVKSGKGGKVTSHKINGFKSEFDKGVYKHNKVDAYKGGIEYWKNSEAGETVDFINKNANGSGWYEWENTLNNLKHTFDNDTVNNDLEKIYNLGKLHKDIMGNELDNKHYDARKYENPNLAKIEGVSGHDIFKKDLRIEELDKEIEDLKKEIVHEHDDDKINELEKQIQADEDEIKYIRSQMDRDDGSSEAKDELEKKYKSKVNSAKDEKSADSIDKGINNAENFVTNSKSADLSQLDMILKLN